MSQNYRRQSMAFLIWCIAVSAGLCISFVGCQPDSSNTALKQPEGQLSPQEQEALALRVDPGDAGKAVKYYTDSLEELGLKNWQDSDLPKDDPDAALEKLATLQSLAQALEFLDYKDLFPADFEKNIENLSSGDLMAKYPKEILASAFFAPKITDVSVGDPSKINVGWRKVVYLKARKGSMAEAKGISYGLLLFNKFQGKGNFKEDPIKPRKIDKSNESKTTQLILIRADGSTLKFPAYFLVYGKLSEGGKLKPTLDASFDARAPEFQPARPYYVPNACAQCHGAEIGVNKYDLTKVRLNFLDTDHWFDRVQGTDDFAFLQQYDYGVLYDGGKIFDVKAGDPVSQQFQDAFNVLRQLNEIIKDQNEKVDTANPGVPPADPHSFQFRAVIKWLELHTKGDQTDFAHKDVFQRSLNGKVKWSDSNPVDKDLLPLMNQYCYRCHSSVRYSIFDRELVWKKRVVIPIRLNSPDKEKWMPQDRELTPTIKEKILKLIGALQEKP
jgi:hypothetical protein